MLKHEVKTRSELNRVSSSYCVYKTVLHHQNGSFVYYGKQSFNDAPDSRYIGSGRLLKEKLNEMGDTDLIEKTVLSVFDDEQDALDFEQQLILNARKCNENLLNICSGGAGGNRLDRVSESGITIRSAKISINQTGRKFSEASIEKMRQAKLGKKRSIEAREAISKGRLGMKIGPRSAETIEKMKAAQQKRRKLESELSK
ncbi:hypothetical protein KGP17_17535 [Serratia sp. JSRIV001]|uniref:hypothetical protein n=1 Tax=Serratia sp. JSRIV001 TaxID=2831893 RepID=UPI001CBDF3E6|nr:hypothetical protein [Serratia sp. JSRIV001]UAN44255.1 hypothetical protein KGP17_17535 [Serratia sp. JSRIV001]